MAQMKQAKIMIGRCNDKRPFAIRVEYENNDWVRTWAFELSERMLKNERYGEEKITGSFYAVVDVDSGLVIMANMLRHVVGVEIQQKN